MQTEIILGGDGFLGSHLARALSARGSHIQIVDLKRGDDLRTCAPRVPDGPAYVWFLAWDVGGAKYLLHADRQLQILRNNLAICETVFPWIAKHRLPCTFVGSQMSTFPNAYGLTKQVGEYWARQTEHCHVARLWNIFGLEPTIDDRSHVVTDLVRSGLAGEVRCMTDGGERRQLLYVKDCVEGLLRQRENRQPIADLSTGTWTPIREVATLIAREMGKPVRFGETRGYESLVEPQHVLDGWSPRFSLEAGIRDLLREVGAAPPSMTLSAGERH